MEQLGDRKFWKVQPISDNLKDRIYEILYDNAGNNVDRIVDELLMTLEFGEEEENAYFILQLLVRIYGVNHIFLFPGSDVRNTLLSFYCLSLDLMQREDLIDYLLENGADPNIAHDDPITIPLMAICYSTYNNLSVLRKLLYAGADTNINILFHGKLYSPLLLSLATGKFDYVYEMQGFGLDINKYDEEDLKATPLGACFNFYFRPFGGYIEENSDYSIIDIIRSIEKLFLNGLRIRGGISYTAFLLRKYFNKNTAVTDMKYNDLIFKLVKLLLDYSDNPNSSYEDIYPLDAVPIHYDMDNGMQPNYELYNSINLYKLLILYGSTQSVNRPSLIKRLRGEMGLNFY